MTDALFYRYWGRRPADLPEVSVLAVGDIMLSREVGRKIAEHGPDFPFAKIRTLFAQDGIIVGNLENPISLRGVPSPLSQSNFKADPMVVEGLAKAGFQILALANNHIYDYGGEAIEDTLRLLEKQGIYSVGVGGSYAEARRPVIISVKERKIAFLSYTSAYNATDQRQEYVASPINLKWIKEDIAQTKEKIDICVVSLHFGYENVEYPPPECRQQARQIIEYGADLVLGHHPHIIHGLEFYKRGCIAYSLGNFVFDNLTERRRESFVFRATFDKDGVQAIDLLPVWINDEYQPQPASDEIATNIISRVNKLSGYFQDGSSDRRFWEAASGNFLSNQKTAFIRSIKRNGLKAIFMRLKHMRLFHLRLFVVTLFNKARRIIKK